MIKYIGSKRELIPLIVSVVESFPQARSVIDLFSGTSRVGYALKDRGYRVLANDHNAYAHTLATCYVQADSDRWEGEASRLIKYLDTLRGSPGFFTEHFCHRSRYLRPENGERVDAIRVEIDTLQLDSELRAIALTSLLEAADRVDSTTGLQMAYLKQWSKRSENPLSLRLPELLPISQWGKGEAHKLDAFEAAGCLKADLAYLDPPYNQHSYLGNYHVWETLVKWDRPDVYGIACKRSDVRDRRSVFNSKSNFHQAFKRVVDSLDCQAIIVSFSDEGFCSKDEMREILSSRGDVAVITRPFRRYVGAQIGIYNPAGAKVGKVGRLRNHERIFVCSGTLPSAILEMADSSDG